MNTWQLEMTVGKIPPGNMVGINEKESLSNVQLSGQMRGGDSMSWSKKVKELEERDGRSKTKAGKNLVNHIIHHK